MCFEVLPTCVARMINKTKEMTWCTALLVLHAFICISQRTAIRCLFSRSIDFFRIENDFFAPSPPPPFGPFANVRRYCSHSSAGKMLLGPQQQQQQTKKTAARQTVDERNEMNETQSERIISHYHLHFIIIGFCSCRLFPARFGAYVMRCDCEACTFTCSVR